MTWVVTRKAPSPLLKSEFSDFRWHSIEVAEMEFISQPNGNYVVDQHQVELVVHFASSLSEKGSARACKFLRIMVAANTTAVREGSTSFQSRVLSPQSGFTHELVQQQEDGGTDGQRLGEIAPFFARNYSARPRLKKAVSRLARRASRAEPHG